MMKIDHTFDALDAALLTVIGEDLDGVCFDYIFRDAGVHGEATKVAKWPTLTWTLKIVSQRLKTLVKAKKIVCIDRLWIVKR